MSKSGVGINHIEFWVSDLRRSVDFYSSIFEAAGWKRLSASEFSSGSCMVYFVEKPVKRVDGAGPRHLCLNASSREIVDEVAAVLRKKEAEILRGPVEMPEYSKGYYTVDFRDPDGYVLEVAHTPAMKF